MKKIYWVLPLIVIALVLAWYLASPLFIDKTVNEEIPPIDTDINGEIPTDAFARLYEGSFMDADASHKVSGQALVFADNQKTYLRLENFESTNGPALKVYLSEETNADSYISLGSLKGNKGNQNYEIPTGTDLEKFNKVLIWCEPFRVLFGSAEITQTTS